MDLLGNIYITTDKGIVYETLNTRPDIKLVNLDEENKLRIDPNRYIVGSILLPPVEAIIAEVDGDEQKYDFIYNAHISSDIVREYIACLLAFLYRGGSVLMYFPDEDYNNTLKKLLYFILINYGVHIGIIEDQDPNNQICYLDNRYDGLILDLIYFYTGIIDWREYLFQYPINLPIKESIMDIILNQMKPFGNTYKEKIDTVLRIRERIKKNPKIIVPITM